MLHRMGQTKSGTLPIYYILSEIWRDNAPLDGSDKEWHITYILHFNQRFGGIMLHWMGQTKSGTLPIYSIFNQRFGGIMLHWMGQEWYVTYIFHF